LSNQSQILHLPPQATPNITRQGDTNTTVRQEKIHEEFISSPHCLHNQSQDLRRMKKYYPLFVVALGILLIVLAVGYAVIFPSLPGPDDPPAEVARVSMQGNIVFAGVCAGALCILGGVVVSAFRLLSRKQRPQA